MELKNSILSLQWDALTVKRKINNKIRNLPDNKNIQRLSTQPNCYIMQFSEIMKDKHNILSPEYYDFNYQYRAIVKQLKKIDPLTIYNFIVKAIEDKFFFRYNGVNKYSQPNKEKILLHPEVIKYLKTII
jgi:hypothetical protein